MSLEPIDSKKDALDRISGIVKELTAGGNKRLTIAAIMQKSRGFMNPAFARRYVQGWDYYADRELPPEMDPETFEARGYADAQEIIG